MQEDLKKQRFDLIQAVLGNNFGLVKNTIKKRFSLANARNDERTPILLLAMEKDYHRIVKYLMENGANLAARDGLNRNFFHVGAINNSVNSMLIVNHILRLNLQSSTNDVDKASVRELLTGQSVDLNTPMHFAVRHQSPAMLKIFLKLLFYYCSNEEELISALTRTNYNLHTILHTAVYYLSPKCVKLLLKTERLQKLFKNSRLARGGKCYSITKRNLRSVFKQLAVQADCTNNNVAFVLCTIQNASDPRIIQVLDLLHKYCNDALTWNNEENICLAEYADENDSTDLLTRLVQLGYTKNMISFQ